MKNTVIKVVIIIFAISAYFNVSQFYDMKALREQNELLQESILELENLPDSIDDSCNKLHEITIKVVADGEEFDQSYVHCTNKVYLGDALDEITDEIQIVFDPNYDKEYIYGRLVHSFYGLSKEYEEYYEITIDTERSTVGVDFVEIEDGHSYEFTLVRWS